MSLEPKDWAYAVVVGVILAVLPMLISVLALRALPDKPTPQRIVTICSGCGSEWSLVSPVGGPMKPIDTCPNCPLSMDEFELLKKEMREKIEREKNKGGGE